MTAFFLFNGKPQQRRLDSPIVRMLAWIACERDARVIVIRRD